MQPGWGTDNIAKDQPSFHFIQFNSAHLIDKVSPMC